MNRVLEHEIESVAGVPGRLPPDEHVLWQGAPAFLPAARRVFHYRLVGVYFALLAAWQVIAGRADGAGIGEMIASITWTLTLGAGAIAILLLLGWLVHRTTIYTITNRRVVMTIGMALPMSLNIPFKAIESASSGIQRDGSGDIALRVADEHRIAYAVLWPHARPWHVRNPQPTLRSLPDAGLVADILRNALHTR